MYVTPSTRCSRCKGRRKKRNPSKYIFLRFRIFCIFFSFKKQKHRFSCGQGVDPPPVYGHVHNYQWYGQFYLPLPPVLDLNVQRLNSGFTTFIQQFACLFVQAGWYGSGCTHHSKLSFTENITYATENYSKKNRFRSHKSRHCAYILYSVKTRVFLKRHVISCTTNSSEQYKI